MNTQLNCGISSGSSLFTEILWIFKKQKRDEIHHNLEILTCNPFICTRTHPKIYCIKSMGESYGYSKGKKFRVNTVTNPLFREKKLLVGSEDYGKDLTGVQNLRKKHKRLDAELASHEPAIQVTTCCCCLRQVFKDMNRKHFECFFLNRIFSHRLPNS